MRFHSNGLIKRISSSQSGVPQIVTTNFDRLFEAGQEGEHLVLHVPPAFPDLNFGSAIEGITYLHGRLVETAAESHPYVLSSADFGRAYLSEGGGYAVGQQAPFERLHTLGRTDLAGHDAGGADTSAFAISDFDRACL